MKHIGLNIPMDKYLLKVSSFGVLMKYNPAKIPLSSLVDNVNARHMNGSSGSNFILIKERGILYAHIVTIFIKKRIPSISVMLYFCTPLPLFYYAVIG